MAGAFGGLFHVHRVKDGDGSSPLIPKVWKRDDTENIDIGREVGTRRWPGVSSYCYFLFSDLNLSAFMMK